MLRRSLARNGFAATAVWRQVQRPQDYWSQHGLPAEKPVSVGQQVGGRPFAGVDAGAPPRTPMDLERTKLNAGQGTDGKTDPYNRTLPNVELRDPISTVSTSTSLPRAPTSMADIAKHWGTLGEWFGKNGLLNVYLEAFKVDELLMPSTANTTLKTVTDQLIPEAAVSRGLDANMEKKQWDSIVKKFLSRDLIDILLFDKSGFEGELAKLCTTVENYFKGEHKEHMTEVAELLRRRAIHARNSKIDELKDFVTETSSDFVWGNFFHLGDRQYVELKKTRPASEPDRARSTDSVAALWEAGRHSGTVLPAMKASVALYFALSVYNNSTALANNGVSAANRPPTARVYSIKEEFPAPTEEKEAFLRENLPALFAQGNEAGFLHAAHGVLSPRMITKVEQYVARVALQAKLDKAEVFDFVQQLAASEANARQIVLSMLSVGDEKSRSKVRTLFRISSRDTTGTKELLGSNPVAEAFQRDKFWASNAKAISESLLTDSELYPSFVTGLASLVKNNTPGAMFTDAILKALEEIKDKRENREHDIVDLASRLFNSMANKDGCTTTELLRLLSKYGFNVDSLRVPPNGGTDAAGGKTELSAELMKTLLETPGTLRMQVTENHKKWVKDGVLSATTPQQSSSLVCEQSTCELMRMYLRLTWSPHSVQALLNARHRNRSGNVSVKGHQFNMPVEVGQAQHYNNLEYKQYDWAGWYQRMWDIHLRNSTLRLPLRDVKSQLASDGFPLVDFQSERRLRVVAGERVGNSIIKLDTDRFEDKADNLEYGSLKLQQLVSESRKATLGREYWPSVEVKVRRLSGQTKMQYSLVDWDRIETASTSNYKSYKELKKNAIFCPPTKLWLKEPEEVQVTADDLFASLSE